jgi:putative Flp pilus-assembly TadE/G-like protein
MRYPRAGEESVGAGTALLRLRCDNRGVTAVLVALTLAALIGLVGLGTETGLWYTIKRVNQSAADVAALSGAFEVLAGQPYEDVCGFAKRDAARDGFTFSGSWSCPASTPACTSPPSSGGMCANNPPMQGAYTGNVNAVEVILAQQQNALLASLNLANVTITTRGVAVVSVLDQSCMLALNQTASQALLIQGNSTINMPNCSLVSDSNDPNAIFLRGSAATVTADTIRSHGGVGTTGNPTFNLNTPAQTNAPIVPDPYQPPTCNNNTPPLCLTHSFLTTGPPALPTSPVCGAPMSSTIASVIWWTYPGNCVVTQGPPGTALTEPNIILSANTQISGGIQIKSQTVNLSPGTYWINNGDLQLGPGGGTSLLECTTCNGGSLGVTIIFTTTGAPNKIGAVQMQSTSAQIGNLNAPNSGTFKGLLFVQDTVAGASYSTSGTLQGGPSAALVADGLIYIPHTTLAFQGTPALGTSGCLIVIADQVQVVGNSTLSATGCTSAGLNSTPTVKTVSLKE